jgi:hypothetical protein
MRDDCGMALPHPSCYDSLKRAVRFLVEFQQPATLLDDKAVRAALYEADNTGRLQYHSAKIPKRFEDKAHLARIIRGFKNPVVWLTRGDKPHYYVMHADVGVARLVFVGISVWNDNAEPKAAAQKG